MSQILANATVDILTPSTPIQYGQFKVHVWGVEPYDYKFDYIFRAKNNTQAAQFGIKKFVEEAEKLGPKGS